MTVLETLPATLRLGPVHLTVADLGRTVAWYERSLGLTVSARDSSTAELGDGAQTLLVLHADPEAHPPGEHASLFHYCLNYPTREELARAVLRLRETGTPISQLRDRHTHEAIYVADCENNTVELAWDLPREEWPEDPYGHEPTPLDEAVLVSTVAGESAPARPEAGLFVGHVHFSVAPVDCAIEFYRDHLGLELKYRVWYGAFFSVGGYHHHTAANFRRGERLDAQPPHTMGLRHWTIELPESEDVDVARERLSEAGYGTEPIDGGFAVSDPWQLRVHVVS
ncbi:MAG TPA: VOC family protein [Solirubrobacteraceae bacterium]|nr:VOC family protein [Solirubrobacteraceae bacterium]